MSTRIASDVAKEQKQRKKAAPKPKKAKGVVVPEQQPAATGSVPTPAAKRTKGAQALVIGREPRVDLLPTEVHVDRRDRAVARRAWIGVVVLAAIVVVGSAGATLQRLHASTDLTNTQAETSSLLLEQQKYAEVRTVEHETTLVQAAQAVGGSTEIDWQKYLTDLQTSLPSGVQITGLNVTSATPMKDFSQPTTPLQGARIGELDITVTSTTIPSVPDWTQSLSSLPGYVDSSIDSISASGGNGVTSYTASIQLHINEKAYDGKYAGKQ